jgi:hypothetical protein
MYRRWSRTANQDEIDLHSLGSQTSDVAASIVACAEIDNPSRVRVRSLSRESTPKDALKNLSDQRFFRSVKPALYLNQPKSPTKPY